ncbi:MAG: DoxX family protein [Cyclobacteriaceae bacterium]
MENSKGMRIAATVARYLLGLIFLVFGLNGFLGFLPQPDMGPEAGAFMGALVSTGYFFPMVKLLEVVSGILLLTGKYVPLAIAILGPITLNIFMFHAVMEPGGLPIAIVVFGANILLAVANKDKFKGVFSK